MQTDIRERIRAEIERAETSYIVLNPEFLDDEQLSRERQFDVLTEIFKCREMLFEPYDAESLRKILEMRVEKALRADRIGEGVVPFIAALACQQHGDARKAVNLLRRSADLAEQEGGPITTELVERANEEIERDKYVDMIRSSPRQLQAALYAALTGHARRGVLQTGDAYLVYERFCGEVGLRPLTQRAFSDLICELDMYGFIRARTVSRGRYGRSKDIHVALATGVHRDLVGVIRGSFDLAPRGVRLA